ncbi:hypothetical protein MF271_01735 (plasmid) [Deinococcus sp. KNUC1210]|uniref:hypothetical protein n=1 Tax=Deinococcus sp. KNUC1210 TaxID=2917691 RepID=UPI001EF0FD7D|nr:hypothetical protein [Deinococcus sp. KNUC1210]ULH14268.1 hypothetical protein MF271_01735 [Deinococcus sp. KNUC1210]
MTSSRWRGLACWFMLLTTGCAPAFLTVSPSVAFQGALTPRPEGSPDILMVTFSGRCPCFNVPGDNVDYLTARGTSDDLAAPFRARGLSVLIVGASGHLTAHVPLAVHNEQLGSGVTVAPPQEGFVQMEARLVAAQRDWIVGRSNPTRIVLVGHSHGVVWTHALARAHPDIPISALIDLDGICDLWELDNRRLIQDYVKQAGQNPWPFDLSNSCASVRVGHVRYDLKDVVYPNVALNVEIQTQPLVVLPGGGTDLNFPFDRLANIRPDGSHAGIQTRRFSSETHTSVTLPGLPALMAVKSMLSPWLDAWQAGLNMPACAEQAGGCSTATTP